LSKDNWDGGSTAMAKKILTGIKSSGNAKQGNPKKKSIPKLIKVLVGR